MLPREPLLVTLVKLIAAVGKCILAVSTWGGVMLFNF